MGSSLSYYAYRALGASVGRLPLRIGYRLAGWLVPVVYWLMPNVRRVVTHNIRHVLGPEATEAQVKAVVKRDLRTILKAHYEFLHLRYMTADEVKRIVQVEGEEHLRQALAQGRGVLLISSHTGNLDLAGQVIVLHGLPLTSIAERLEPERLFDYVSGLRERFGLQLIPIDEVLIGIFRRLKRGEIISLPCDRDTTGMGRPVTFFGAPTTLPDGPVRIALRTGAPVVRAFVRRLPDNHLLAKIYPPLEFVKTGDQDAIIEAGMKQIIAWLEQNLGQYPDQWLAASPVWPME